MDIIFKAVAEADAAFAHRWFTAFAENDTAIHPRSPDKFLEIIQKGHAWSAVSKRDGPTPVGEDPKYVYHALCYGFVDENSDWEVGGLMVAEGLRNLGLGGIIYRLPIITMLTTEQGPSPDTPPHIITHRRARNELPKKLIEGAGFINAKPFTVPVAQTSFTDADDANGNVHGIEYELDVPAAIYALADWCDRWTGKLGDGKSTAVVQWVGIMTMDKYATALREIADRMPPRQ